jgi:hypothetical protein
VPGGPELSGQRNGGDEDASGECEPFSIFLVFFGDLHHSTIRNISDFRPDELGTTGLASGISLGITAALRTRPSLASEWDAVVGVVP